MKSWLNIFTIALTCLCAGSLFAADVQNVRVYRDSDHTRLVFDLDGPVDHSLLTLDNPNRIVVDLAQSTFHADINLDMSGTPLTGLRNSPRNGDDLRIVLDLSSKVEPRSFTLIENEQYGHRLVIDLYDDETAAPAENQGSERRVTASAQDIDNAQRDIVVAISAGHGGSDPGSIGIDGSQEKRVAFSIAQKLKQVLNNTPGYKTVMIRSGDYKMELRERTRLAHEHDANFYIAIHADAYKNADARGATIYALSQRGATSEQARMLAAKENGAGSELIGGTGSVSLDDKDDVLASVLIDLYSTGSLKSSLEAGEHIIAAMGQVTRMRRTNVEQAAFVELKNVDIPSLLVENGYMTNPTDVQNLNSSSHQQKLAEAIAQGITGYFYDTPPAGSWVSWQKEHGGQPRNYTVASGDSLSKISERFNISLSNLKNVNGLTSNTIFIGQALKIPTQGTFSSSPIRFIEHTISRGETLSGIAGNYHVSLQRIRETNQLNSDTIWVGQVLKIPSS